MPAAAFALLAVFIGLSIIAGLGAWWLVGVRRWWGVILPVFATFAALYLVGHLLDLSPGPTVRLFGFDVALAFDIGIAVLVAAGVALLQRLTAGLLTRDATAEPRLRR
jgi:hypothetical protein